jgi:dachs protein
MDVVRVLAAILLLGNVEFAPGGGDESYEVDVIGKEELNSVANLLGVSTASLWQGLTTRTQAVRGQLIKSMSDSNLVSRTVT